MRIQMSICSWYLLNWCQSKSTLDIWQEIGAFQNVQMIWSYEQEEWKSSTDYLLKETGTPECASIFILDVYRSIFTWITHPIFSIICLNALCQEMIEKYVLMNKWFEKNKFCLQKTSIRIQHTNYNISFILKKSILF